MNSTQWANIGDDAGALHALVARLTEQVPVPLIDFLWIFPARRIAIGESIVLVVAAFDEDGDRRRVITAHFTVARNRKGVAQVGVRFDEHGSAPATAVPRIVSGVLRRMGEDADAEPREEGIAGDSARWNALIVELGGREDPARIEGEVGDVDGGQDVGGHVEGGRVDGERVDGGHVEGGRVDAGRADVV